MESQRILNRFNSSLRVICLVERSYFYKMLKKRNYKL